jgi:hypothetical protein
MLRKAAWIAKQLKEDREDVYDVLLGNITKPRSLVDAVAACESEYDSLLTRGTGRKDKVDSGSTEAGRFSSY